MMWSVAVLEITDEERAELERRVRAHTSTQRAVKRARVVLLAAEGVANRRIGEMVGMDQHYVGVWRRRFETDRLPGLEDRPRSGRPRVYGHDERVRIVAKATSERPETESHWSHRLLAEDLADDMGISESQVGRILAELDIKPHRVRSWLSRPDDPDFWERAADVCGLYLSPPQNALVLSVDEKTAVPARSRKHPTRPAEPGRPERQEFEYRRHGTASFITALNVVSGEVLARDVDRNTAVNFISFLEDIDRMVDPTLEIHLVMDNGAAHVAKATKAWLADHPRFVAHHTPKHASWLNQVELFFSILTRRLLRRGEFSSRDDLIGRVMDFIREHNSKAKPFRWTYDGSPLKAA
ncbi:MAG TPA: IS630 family transposase [Acidimicrobiia bacterium]|nr:IS630 family transposase [Acidimicrobiia bacterium]